MKMRDKVMYFGSSALSILALGVYLLLAPATASASAQACNGCQMSGNCWPVGTCWSCGSTTGELCTQVGSTYYWEACGSCTI